MNSKRKFNKNGEQMIVAGGSLIEDAASDKMSQILFADDDEFNFMLIQKLITSHNSYNCTGFYNGKDLFNEFSNNRSYDLIILDIQMPVMDGIECLEKIRTIDKKIPVLALTAFALKNDEQKFLNMGFSDYISKPINSELLFKKMKRHIDQGE